MLNFTPDFCQDAGRRPCLAVIQARRQQDGVLNWHRGRAVLEALVILEDRDLRAASTVQTRSSYSGLELLRAFEEAVNCSPARTDGLMNVIREANQFVFRLELQIPLAHVGSFFRDLFRRADAADALISARTP